MNRDKELKLAHSVSKAQRWHMGLIWGFIFAFGIINFGCENGETDDADEYYVKYEVNSSTSKYSDELDVLITESNKNTAFKIEPRTEWETVIGPVQKSFIAIIEVSPTEVPYEHISVYRAIHVSKNGGPFALKAFAESDIQFMPTDTLLTNPDYTVELDHIIDY